MNHQLNAYIFQNFGNFFSRHWLILIAIVMMSACTTVSTPSVNTITSENGVQKAAPVTPTEITRATRPVEQLPEKIPPDIELTPLPVTDETPESLLNAIKADLAARENVAIEEITVIRDQEVVWSDGSLGCPQPDMVYTQATVDGYWVVLQIEGQEYDYRASESGFFFLCESEFSFPSITPSDPGSGPAPSR